MGGPQLFGCPILRARSQLRERLTWFRFLLWLWWIEVGNSGDLRKLPMIMTKFSFHFADVTSRLLPLLLGHITSSILLQCSLRGVKEL